MFKEIKTIKSRVTMALAAVMLLSAADVHAAPITQPTGLSFGASYRLVFVTSGTTTATSTDIATYNTFVSNAANAVSELAALSTTWSAIGSTATVDARDNTNTNPSSAGVPIYLLDGSSLVAASNTDFWDGTISSAIDLDENGNTFSGSSRVWAGTNANGTKSPSRVLGDVSGQTRRGLKTATNDDWIMFANDLSIGQLSLYAISDVITISEDSPIPEPGMMLIFGAGLIGLVAIRRRRQI